MGRTHLFPKETLVSSRRNINSFSVLLAEEVTIELKLAICRDLREMARKGGENEGHELRIAGETNVAGMVPDHLCLSVFMWRLWCLLRLQNPTFSGKLPRRRERCGDVFVKRTWRDKGVLRLLGSDTGLKCPGALFLK